MQISINGWGQSGGAHVAFDEAFGWSGAPANKKGYVKPADFRAFCERVRAKVAALKSASGAATGGGAAIDQLERLAKLRSSGALTEEVFQAAKRDILGL